jgi:hypothetical protein
VSYRLTAKGERIIVIGLVIFVAIATAVQIYLRYKGVWWV